MKKILICLITLIMCCACGSYDKEITISETDETQLGQFGYVEYDGHEYLIWKSRGYAGGITHSPNCHCLKNKNE